MPTRSVFNWGRYSIYETEIKSQQPIYKTFITLFINIQIKFEYFRIDPRNTIAHTHVLQHNVNAMAWH